METAYAQALWNMVGGGMKPGVAVHSLREMLMRQGREHLLPRIARAFARLAARDQQKNQIVLSIAKEKDAGAARRAIKGTLAEMNVSAKDVTTAVDETLIGGWRLEGREHLVDASFKKYLLDVYNRVTAA